MANEKKVIKCIGCGKNYPFSTEAVKQKKIFDFIQVVVVCPHCNAEAHSYFTSKTIEKRSARLKTKRKHQYDSPIATREYLAAQSKFESYFKDFQISCSNKLQQIPA